MNVAINLGSRSANHHREKLKLFVTFHHVLFKNTMHMLLLKLKKEPRKQLFEPIDIAYDPVQNFDDIVGFSFTLHLHIAYYLQYLRGKKELEFVVRFNATHAISLIPLKKHLKIIFNAALKYLELYINLTTQTW